MLSALSATAWTSTSDYPTTYASTLTSIATSCAPALSESLSIAKAKLETATALGELIQNERIMVGAQASLSIISAQEVLATATADAVKANATEAIYEALDSLDELAFEENLYGVNLNHGGNIFFLVVFASIFLYNVLMMIKSRYHWYNIAFVCGYTLEFLGFLGRVLSFRDNTNISYFLLQFVSLTLAPAFIMAGVYFLFAQHVAIYGRQYSVLKPMWYSYFFIGCDVVSLIVQGIGGGVASVANSQMEDPSVGTWIMFSGVLFQVVAMSIFVLFWLEFISRIYFHDTKCITVDSPLKKRTPASYFKLLFHTPSTRAYKRDQLNQFYNPKFEHIRNRPLMPYYPIAVTIAVILIYIRCVYRVVELEQGFTGYLITNEAYLMVLDASMIALAGLIFVPFHPVFVFGADNVLKVTDVTSRDQVFEESEETNELKSENPDSTDESSHTAV